MTFADIALEYAARGWPVVPILPGDKRPAISRWTERATTDPDFIEGWWRAHPDHGIGIATGPTAGFFVVDVDVSDGKNGDETLADLEKTHGRLPDTVEVVTGSGGRHLYYKYPAGQEIRNDAGKRLGPGLDIRGVGGQVVAPPTVHPNGTPYAWELSHHPDDTEISDAPGWLLELLADTASSPAAPDSAPNSPPNSSDTRPGTRFNQNTTWTDLLEGDGWAYSHTDIDGIESHWTRPGKDTRQGTSATVNHRGSDRLKVFTSSVAGLDPDGSYSRFEYWTACHHNGDYRAAATALHLDQETADLASWAARIDQHRSISPLVDLADAGCDLGRWAVNWPEFWTADHKETDWLVEPYLARGRQHALHAGAKTGKSLLTLEVCAALAVGRQILGRPGGLPPESVLYIDYEMTPDDLHERLTTFGYQGVDLAHLHYILLPSIAGIDTPEGGRKVCEAAHHYDAQLVVVDTTARAVQGPENEADTYRNVYRHTGLGLKAAGRTFQRLDHSGKDASKGQRGSSAKNDDVDIVHQMTRKDGQQLQLKATHRRLAWVPEIVNLALIEQPDGTERFELTELAGWAHGTADAADQLDRLGLDPAISVNAARRALNDSDVPMSNSVLRDAVKYRKSGLRPPGQEWQK